MRRARTAANGFLPLATGVFRQRRCGSPSKNRPDSVSPLRPTKSSAEPRSEKSAVACADAYLLFAWVSGCGEGLLNKESSSFGFTTTFSMDILCVTL